MNRITKLPDTFDSNDIIPQVNTVKDQIKNLTKIYESFEKTDRKRLLDKYVILQANIKDILYYWTRMCSVGYPKNKKFIKAYSVFFEQLLEWLKKLQNSKIEYFKEFSNKALFQGTVYRCIHNENNYNKEPVLRYENNYVSWSKNSYVPYLEQKIKGKLLHITCEIKDEYYGIDLEAFDVVAGEEAEVVFPTVKELIIKTEVIR